MNLTIVPKLAQNKTIKALRHNAAAMVAVAGIAMAPPATMYAGDYFSAKKMDYEAQTMQALLVKNGATKKLVQEIDAKISEKVSKDSKWYDLPSDIAMRKLTKWHQIVTQAAMEMSKQEGYKQGVYDSFYYKQQEEQKRKQPDTEIIPIPSPKDGQWYGVESQKIKL